MAASSVLYNNSPQGKRDSKESGDPDEFDDLVTSMTGKSLAARLGNSPDMILKKSKAKKTGDGMKQSKLNFKKVCSLEIQPAIVCIARSVM